MEVEKIHRICDLLDIDRSKMKTTKIDVEKILLVSIMLLFIIFIFSVTMGYMK